MKKLGILLLILSLIISIVGCATDKTVNKGEVKSEVIAEVKSEDLKTEETEESDVEASNEAEETSDEIADSESVSGAGEVVMFPDYIIDNTESSVTYIDKFGTETTISKNPERVVIAYNSILGLWYFAGGKSLTKVKGSTNVPEEATDLIDLGSMGDLSLEAIIAQEPDLVILAANYEAQVAMAPSLKEMGIETMIVDISINSYERFKENSYLFSLINDTHDIYEDKIMPINDHVNEIIEASKASESSPKVAAIFASSRSIKLESNIAMVGEMVELLGGSNLIDEADVPEGETRIAFSVEALVTQNPEIITISTMGGIDGVKENMDKMIAENPVWNEVDAVKNGKVYYLPKEYSVYKANELYAEAFDMMAKILYPEIFGE